MSMSVSFNKRLQHGPHIHFERLGLRGLARRPRLRGDRLMRGHLALNSSRVPTGTRRRRRVALAGATRCGGAKLRFAKPRLAPASLVKHPG
jgi:hypothetical protein